MTGTDPAEVAATWARAGVGWVREAALFDATFAPLTRALVAAADLQPGVRLLDVGCGSGTLLAAAAEAGAEPVGVDVSPAMVEAARRRVPSATVVLADAQRADLDAEAPGAPYDRVVSRFGVMFFDDPTAAFARIHAACAPGGRLAFVCWRRRGENPSFALGQGALYRALGEEPDTADSPAPGPMAFADPDRVRTVLGAAGWRDVRPEPLDTVLDYSFDGSDGVEHRTALVLATSTGARAHDTVLPRLGEDGWRRVVAEVRTEVRAGVVDGALRLPAACWLVTATA
ncbi:class I SAM-dependent methyltransferase [Nocardioides litoris]|uniref:class I SAM-dependent methyltransferase n=1 Tax=Nocardioides litoris TaxID=1926648 RepID=UPI001B870FA0|nr:class I SAM-dependent methyltransferase [Nocardioides litoris]